MYGAASRYICRLGPKSADPGHFPFQFSVICALTSSSSSLHCNQMWTLVSEVKSFGWVVRRRCCLEEPRGSVGKDETKAGYRLLGIVPKLCSSCGSRRRMKHNDWRKTMTMAKIICMAAATIGNKLAGNLNPLYWCNLSQ